MTELTYTLEDLRGVGRVELALRPNQRAYVFFGSNGVGKTKTNMNMNMNIGLE